MSDRETLREELGALLDGALERERAAELEARLARDPELRREYDELRRTVEAVRGLRREGAPAELRARLEQRLAAPPPRALPTRWLAAAALLLVAVGLFALWPRDDGPTPLPPEARTEEKAAPAETRDRAGRADEGARFLEEPPPGEPDAAAERAREALEELRRAPEDLTRPDAPLDDAPRREKKAAEPRVGRVAKETEDQERKAEAEEPLPVPDALVVAIEKMGRLPAERRADYLARLAELTPAQVRRHVLAVAALPAPRAKGEAAAQRAGVPALPPVRLRDRREADAVSALLRGFAPEGGPAVEVAADGVRAVETTVEGTPAELERVRAWLELLDAGREEKARGATFGAAGGAPPAGKETAPERKERRRVVLRYGEPPAEPDER